MENGGNGKVRQLIGLQSKHGLLWLVSLVVLALFVLRTPLVLSRLLQDLGSVALARSLATASDEEAFQLTSRAETLLQRAVDYVPENHSAWRGLGFALAVQGQEERAVAAWQNAGGMAEELIWHGQQAQKQMQYQKALRWYTRAAEVDPELGDPWYAVGATYEEMDQWEKALEAYTQAADASDFISIGRSSPFYRQGMVYQWGMAPRQVEAALVAYEAAIAVGDFSSDLEAANCHYQRGEILRWTGGEPDAYIAEYQRAIDLDPGHVSAHVYLGVAYYTRYGDAAKAEAEIQKALVLSPKNQWAYYHLGEIRRQEGRVDEAISMYKQAIEIAPDFEIALERLQLLTEGGQE